MDEMTRTNTRANVVSHSALCEGEKVTCEVYCFPTRRLQQNAISCKRTYYNFFSKKMLHQLLSQFHHVELEEEGCHFWYC